MNRNDYTIVVGVKSPELAEPVIQSLSPLQARILVGDKYPSFSKLVNDAVVLCPTEIFIFCSHKVRPKPHEIEELLRRIDEGHGLATLYRLGCFGFKKELLRRIGFFDERYKGGGFEDNDFYIRLQEADISYYEDESIEYIAGKSTWEHPQDDPNEYESTKFFVAKWRCSRESPFIERMLSDVHFYDIGPNDSSVTFKPWSESMLLNFSSWQNQKTVIQGTSCVQGKKILIFGGTGSLGNKLVELYGSNNVITIYSRDENKHWQMSLNNKDKNIKFVIGDIRDYQRVEDTIINEQPNIVIIASALKHIDRCEYDVREAYLTNCGGVENVLRAITRNNKQVVDRVVFISTDKACSPINTYGISKALAEKAVIETAYKNTKLDTKFVIVRYGNVLNSRGSIIPILHSLGETDSPCYTLTHESMTRFIMTQEQSVQLINYAILKGESGDTVIPKLQAMKIRDLLELFRTKYNKSINVGSLRPGEKLAESLINENESMRVVETSMYYIIKPEYNVSQSREVEFDTYNSSQNVLSKQQLYDYLRSVNLL